MSAASNPVTSSLNATRTSNGPCTGPCPVRVTVAVGAVCAVDEGGALSPTQIVEPTVQPMLAVHWGAAQMRLLPRVRW